MLKNTIKLVWLSVLAVLCLLLSACLAEPDLTVSLENGQVYSVDEIEKEFSVYFDDVKVDEAPINDIKQVDSDSSVTLPSAAVGAIPTAEQAARFGISVLNEVYADGWTYNNQVCVSFNEKAAVWIVHGQVEDRYHETDKFGFVIFTADEGEIIALNRVHPED